MTSSEKIGEMLKCLNINAKLFAERLGYERPQIIYDIQKGKTKRISVDLANKIVSVFPQINRSWLLADDGEMLRDKSAGIDQPKAGEGKIPLIPASAFAGGVSGFAPEAISLKNCEMVVSPVSGAEFAIPITGDSMEPEYADGSVAYIRRINEAAFIPWGHTVVLDTENGAFIKRIYPDDQDEKYVWARSINPAYPPMHVPKSSIFRIFRVLGTSRIFTTM